jgi:hypothetical protein
MLRKSLQQFLTDGRTNRTNVIGARQKCKRAVNCSCSVTRVISTRLLLTYTFARPHGCHCYHKLCQLLPLTATWANKQVWFSAATTKRQQTFQQEQWHIHWNESLMSGQWFIHDMLINNNHHKSACTEWQPSRTCERRRSVRLGSHLKRITGRPCIRFWTIRVTAVSCTITCHIAQHEHSLQCDIRASHSGSQPTVYRRSERSSAETGELQPCHDQTLLVEFKISIEETWSGNWTLTL